MLAYGIKIEVLLLKVIHQRLSIVLMQIELLNYPDLQTGIHLTASKLPGTHTY